MGKIPTLSVVTTLYHSSRYLVEFHQRVSAVASECAAEWEIIFVNDGSPDDSAAVVRALRERDDRVALIDLSKNFGHHKAIMTGLAQARGEYVFLLDCDLEEPPEQLSRFWAKLSEAPGVDVIYGVQTGRQDSGTARWGGEFFWRFFNRLAGTSIAPNACTIRLMTRRYVDALCQFRELDFFFGGVAEYVGFQQGTLALDKGSKGVTTYNFRKRFSLFLTAITSFSTKPLWAISVLGFALASLSTIMLSWVLVQWFTRGVSVSGWTSLFISLWFLGGVILGSLGFLGIYLGKIFIQVKGRPFTVAREFLPSRRNWQVERSPRQRAS